MSLCWRFPPGVDRWLNRGDLVLLCLSLARAHLCLLSHLGRLSTPSYRIVLCVLQRSGGPSPGLVVTPQREPWISGVSPLVVVVVVVVVTCLFAAPGHTHTDHVWTPAQQRGGEGKERVCSDKREENLGWGGDVVYPGALGRSSVP
jgi:hypothetical protein